MANSEPPSTQEVEENAFRILLATDIHLGYKEKDVIIGNDSFVTFEEILAHAKQQRVDFILLGGDLFHDTNPSKEALHKCLELLHHYTLGDSPISFEMLSDHEVNYDDPNMNVAIPVFSIHGNHDDPSGHGGLSSMDVLSTSGLLNYFGRCDDLTNVVIKPILLKKGTTQLAMYGLSHIHDNRLARLFRDTKVTMEQPDEKSGEWFNLMTLHQNRVDRGPKNYIPEEVLPDFLDFVLWGHEHDCRVEPEEIAGKTFRVCQPGSSVATSLSEGESIDKHIALLTIYHDKFKCEPIKLETVRPFIFKSINLHDYEDELDLDDGDIKDKVKDLISQIIAEMIEEAKKKETNHEKQPKLPLLRLRVSYQDEAYAFNEIRFGQRYNQLVANPTDIVKMHRIKVRTKVEKRPFDEESMNNAFNVENDDDDIRVEDYVERYFNDPNNSEKLQVLFSNNLSDACRRIAENNDEITASRIIDLSIEKALAVLVEKMPQEEADIEDALAAFRLTGEQVFNDIQTEISKRKSGSNVRFAATDTNEEKENQVSTNSRGSNSGRSTASKATASKAASKPAASGRGRGSSRANATPASPSTRSQQQPTIRQSLARKRAAPTPSITYELDSD